MSAYLDTLDKLIANAVQRGYMIGQEPAFGRLTVTFLKPSARKPYIFEFDGDNVKIWKDYTPVKDTLADTLYFITEA